MKEKLNAYKTILAKAEEKYYNCLDGVILCQTFEDKQWMAKEADTADAAIERIKKRIKNLNDESN